MNQPPGYGPPGHPPPGSYGSPPGGFPPQGPYRAPDGGPPKEPARWVTPLLVFATPGNLGWLVAVSFSLSTQVFRQNPIACVISALVPHAIFTAVFTALLTNARPQWSRARRIVAASYLTSGLAGWVGFVLIVLGVGLVAAACGGCRR